MEATFRRLSREGAAAPDGRMLFSYRFGAAGSGDEVLWEYDGNTTTWTRIG